MLLFSLKMARVSHVKLLEQPLVYSQGSHQPPRLKFKVIVFITFSNPCNSTGPRHLIALHLPFRRLHRLLLLRRDVLPPSLTWFHPLDLLRTMTTKSRILSPPVPILRRNRTSRTPLSSDKQFCPRRSIDLAFSTFTSGYPRCTRTISEQTRSG